MRLAMHSPESRTKLLTVRVEKLERTLSQTQREAYMRWWGACLKQGIAVTFESRHEFLRDLKEDITSR